MIDTLFKTTHLPPDVKEVLEACPSFSIPKSGDQLIHLSCGGPGSNYYEVAYDVPGKGRIVEAVVARVRNGICVNYPESYMRRRDPDAVVIADDQPTDKSLYRDAFGGEFDDVRRKTLDWLKTQDLLVVPFVAGKEKMGVDALVLAPANTGFFAFALATLQGAIDIKDLSPDFSPKAVIYVAPPLRHLYFGGKQVVVHNRRPDVHELFSYNLYPGPSAKKGVYGVLINLGEKEGWVTNHCSTVQVVTPYDNKVTLMHEGAIGSGKSEMLEQVHREPDGLLLLGRNVITGEEKFHSIPRTCELRPVTDDMALCHPSLQNKNGKLILTDAEDGWFVRVNHITGYGKDQHLERLTATPPEPLLFLNIDAVPDSRALIWEHTMDSPGKPCPNPRVVIPRRIVPGVVEGAVSVDIRSMGIRTPPCTKENPTYGIIGLFHVLPPALAWIWRLVAPRGYANPSIIPTEGLGSEGVGSYWPFATGRKVDQVNLLFKQFVSTPKVSYVLIPNQHIGAWETGFMPQWIAREYLARRGNAKFTSEQLRPARSTLLGYALESIQVEGSSINVWFLRVETQPEVGEEAYDQGAKILNDFFKKTLREFLVPDLDPMARRIIECTLSDGTVEDYDSLMGEGTLA